MDDRELDNLLAKGRLSGPARDALWSEIRARTSPTPTRLAKILALPRLWPALTLLLVIGPAVALIALQRNHFTAKGLSTSPISLDIGCNGDCRPGENLMFAVTGLARPGYFAAYAVSPRGVRVDYFPSRTEPTPDLGAIPTRQVLARAIVLEGERGLPGTWSLHAFVLSQPLFAGESLESEKETPLHTLVQNFQIEP
jgi:hypothetical protein